MLKTGYGALPDKSSALTEVMIGLHDQIVALPAATMQGVAVKATAIAWDAGDYGFPGEKSIAGDPDYSGNWDIVDDLRALAGLPSIASLAVQS